MSDTTPPQQPGGPWGPPPPGPPAGAPPPYQGFPPPPPPAPAGGGRGKKRALLAAGGLLAVAAVGGGGFAVYQMVGGSSGPEGPQPAEALPADTVAYFAVDLDPSGKQKVEAIRTLKKFPAFNDEVSIEDGDDIREKAFEEAKKEDDDFCPDLEWEDVDAWLGDKFAGAIVEGPDGEPVPVGVVQVEGEDATRKGIEQIQECADEESEEFGLAFVGDDWAIVTETQEQADDVAEAAGKSTLADDDTYKKWIGETGDAGFAYAYAAPEAGPMFLEYGESMFQAASDRDFDYSDDEDYYVDSSYAGGSSATSLRADHEDEEEIPEELRKALEDFDGAAGTARFADGAFEVEFVAGTGTLGGFVPSDAGAEIVASLPSTTAGAFGLGLGDGWLDTVLEQVGPALEADLGMSAEEALEELEDQTGLTKGDIEALGGEGIAVAVDASVAGSDVEGMDPADVPVGLKIKGDTDKIEGALDKIRDAAGPDAADYLLSKTSGDYVVISANEDYLDKLAEEDGLGDEKAFGDLVPEDGEAGFVLFVSFDAGDNWLDTLVEDLGAPDEVIENVEPLSGVGMSSWVDGDIAHSLLKVTTD